MVIFLILPNIQSWKRIHYSYPLSPHSVVVWTNVSELEETLAKLSTLEAAP
jgi:hypothetical protein